MLDGTLVTDAPFTRSPRTGRVLVWAVLFSAALLSGCASRSQRAPVADHSSVTSSTSAAAKGTYVVRAGDT
ncbi:MAG: peptidase, partial [Castellaniella sp.]